MAGFEKCSDPDKRLHKGLLAALLAPTESIVHQAVKFGFAGGVATVGDFLVYWSMTKKLYIWYIWSAVAGYAVGTVISYVISVRWIFPHRNIKDRRWEFIVFAIIAALALGLTEIILYVTVEYIKIDPTPAKIIAIVLVFPFNFGVRKALMFAHPK